MVEEIIETIFGNSEEIDLEQNPNLISFPSYLKKKTHKSPTFKETLHFLSLYLQDYKITLPTYC